MNFEVVVMLDAACCLYSFLLLLSLVHNLKQPFCRVGEMKGQIINSFYKQRNEINEIQLLGRKDNAYYLEQNQNTSGVLIII